MKSVARFSVWVVLAAVFGFAPCAFGQGPVRDKGVGDSVMNGVLGNVLGSVLDSAPSSMLVLSFGKGGGHQGGNGGGGNGGGGNGNGGNGNGSGGNGCGSQGGGRDGRGNGGCATVPEGGTTSMYLLFAGLCCVGAMALRSRRQAAVSATN